MSEHRLVTANGGSMGGSDRDDRGGWQPLWPENLARRRYFCRRCFTSPCGCAAQAAAYVRDVESALCEQLAGRAMIDDDVLPRPPSLAELLADEERAG